MDLLTLLTLAVGLAMDAFAVSICKGLAMREKVLKKGIIVGVWFGGFQALMPTIGFFLGTQFKDQITSIDHWIAFVLLGSESIWSKKHYQMMKNRQMIRSQ